MARPSDSPYGHFATVYDRIMAGVPYQSWFEYISGIWAGFCFEPKVVLDLCCGTGSMSLLLAKEGYSVVGVDASPTMLEQTARKFRDAGLYAKIIEADMRAFELDEKADAAVCLFDSINYLLEPSDVQAAFRAVAAALKPGGIFLFDANTPHRLAMIKKEVHLFERRDCLVIWSDLWDATNKWWRVQLTGFVKEGSSGDGDEKWLRFDEVHKERAFPLEDVSSWLKDAGFEVLGVYDSMSVRPATSLTTRAYFVARRRSEPSVICEEETE